MPPEVTVCGDDAVTQREFRGELDRIQAACTEHRGQTRSLIERDRLVDELSRGRQITRRRVRRLARRQTRLEREFRISRSLGLVTAVMTGLVLVAHVSQLAAVLPAVVHSVVRVVMRG
jgi:hypothetical protein